MAKHTHIITFEDFVRTRNPTELEKRQYHEQVAALRRLGWLAEDSLDILPTRVLSGPKGDPQP